MERNPNDTLAGTGQTGASALGTGTDSISVTGTGAGNATGGDVGRLDLGSAGHTSGMGGTSGASVADRLESARDTATEKLADARDTAADKLSDARDMAGERLGQAREKASQLKATLADKLEAGANNIRPAAGTTGDLQFAGADGATAAADTNPQLTQLRATGADVMQKTAEFLRSGDLRATVEEQMRTNPGRTLLIAVGLGYVLGKAIRSGDR